MSTDKKPREPIGDLRLQTLIDMHYRQYVRERGDPNVLDTYLALVELQTTRRVLAESRGVA